MKLGREVIEYLKTQFVARQGKSTISDHLTPSADETVNLGSSTYKWDTIYVRNVVADYLTGEGGDADMVDGFHAYAAPNPDALLALNSSSKYPGTVLQTGVAFTVSGNDLILAFSGNPSTIQPDDGAAGGSSSYAARTDHVHAIVAAAPTGSLEDDTGNTEGTATSFARSDHLHAVGASDNPGANAELLKTAADGGIQLTRLGIGIDPGYDNWVQMVANGQVGYYGGPNIRFDNANSELEILFGSNQRATFFDEGGMAISPTHTFANLDGYRYYAYGDLSSPSTRDGFHSHLYHNAGNTASDLRGYYALMRSGPNTSAVVTNMYGCYYQLQGYGGDITSAIGASFWIDSYNTNTTINTAYGVRIDINNSGAGVNAGYGLKIENIDATTPYAIYTGTGKVSLGDALELRGSPAEITTLSNADIEIKPNGSGFVSIGAASPSRMLDVLDDATQLRLTYASDTAKYAEFTVGSTGTVEWDAVSNIVLDPGANNVNPGGSIEDDLGAYNVKWRTLYAAEMYVENLVAQDVMATIGGRIMVAPTTKLDEDLDTTENGVDVEDASAFAIDDYIYLCTAPGDPPVPQVEVMQIYGKSGNTLSCHRDEDGSGANSWLKGDAVVNLGAYAGEGYLELTSTQTIHSHLGPTIAIYARTASTNWNDVNPIVALGNLDSFLGYGTVYGLAIGNDLELSSPASASFQGATITQTEGLKLYNTDITLYDTTTPKVQVVHNEGILLSSGTWGTDTTTFAAVFANDATVTDLDAGDVIIGTPFHATEANKVGIHWDNSTGTLKILGSIVVGTGYGVVVPDAVLYCPFDGPMPIRRDFQVDTNTHLGGVASLSGAVIGQYGKFGKALQVTEATTNYLQNPSWETDANNWTKSAGLDTYNRQGLYSFIGDYGAELYESSIEGTDEYIYSDATNATVDEDWTFSIYIKKDVSNQSSTGRIQLQWLDSGLGSLGYTTQVLDAGDHEFKRYQVSGTAPSSTAYVRAIVSFEGGVAASSVWMGLDGAQLEKKEYATPYCDGSLGIGHSWSGTEHASSSSRTAGQLTYEDIAIPQKGSISCWVYSTAKVSANGNKRVILSAYDASGVALYINTSDDLAIKVGGGTLACAINDTSFPADQWHHIVALFGPESGKALYLNGEELNSTSSGLAYDDAGGYDIGHESGSYQWPGFIDDLVVTERTLTPAEITVLYESHLPVYVRTNKYELMLTDIGHGKVLGSADGLFGWDSAGNEAFALVTGGVTWGSKSLSQGDLLIGDPDGDAFLWYDCSESQLFIQGGIYVGDFSGCVINKAVFYMPFDGPRPYEEDFQVNTTGHLGQKSDISGGIIGRSGKFDKAVQVADATTNMVTNPSAETNTSGWSGSGGLYLFERVTTDGVIGTCCFHEEEVSAAGSNEYAGSTYYSVTGSTDYAFSIYVKQVGYPSNRRCEIRLWWWDSVPTIVRTDQIYCDYDDFDWKCYRAAVTSPSTAINVNIAVLMGLSSGESGNLYFDAVQLEQKSYNTPYCDGSLGIGHTWSGTEHGSSSSRSVASLYYANAGVPAHGSVSFWYSPSYKMSECGTDRYFMDYGGLNGIRLRIGTNDLVYSTVGGSTSNYYTLNDTNCAPHTWHHIVFIWDKNNDEVKFYYDGVKQGSDGPYGTWNPSGDNLYVGCGATGARVNGWMDDFLIVDYILTENDVRRIYESGVSFVVPTNKFELMLTEPGAGKLIGHAGGIFGYDVSGNEAFALTTGTVSWGGQSMAAGDMILGDPGNNSHLFYDASAGQLLFRDSSKATQVYIDTDGTFKACGGDIVLSDGNMEIWDRAATEGSAPSIDFQYDKDPGSAWLGYIMGDYGGTSGSMWFKAVRYTGAPWGYCSVIIGAYDDINSYDPRITLYSTKVCYYTDITDVFMDGNIDVDGNVLYEGVLVSQKNSQDYPVYGANFYNEPGTSTSWDGDTKAVGTYDIDTDASPWNLPTGVRAVHIRLAAKWSTAGDSYYAFARRNGSTTGIMFVRSQVANQWDDQSGWVPCDANGDFEIVVVGGTTAGTYLQIFGYMI